MLAYFFCFANSRRWDFELYRFDLVRYMNQLDSKKVLLLETGINNTFYGKPASPPAPLVSLKTHGTLWEGGHVLFGRDIGWIP